VVAIPLEFVEDAICLSGLTGTKLKCDVIGDYYSFWWGITSGGQRVSYGYPTAIVELNAATGEDYIEDTNETVLGSSGHALELKVTKFPQTANLKVILVEENPECYRHLKNVISRRWPSISLNEAEGPLSSNSSNVFLLNKTLDEAVETIEALSLGNALFFFDPLRSVSYSAIDSVASHRMRSFLQTGTEFIIFVFTSDWLLGREDFAPLPATIEEEVWAPEERETVAQADDFFGNIEWRSSILNNDSVKERERKLIDLYRERLHKWFRYVLPMPFNPKQNQVFHLILCSNYEAGVRATRDFYCSKTRNPRYSPDNSQALRKFMPLHPELWARITGRERPLEWKMLWKIIRDHEEGICDVYCRDLREMERRGWIRQSALDWLEKQGYIDRFVIESPWTPSYNRYIIDWRTIKERLGIDPPAPLLPLSSGDV
jgi:three-Cys-motif partner protein